MIPEIERELGHELQVTAIPYYEWESRKKNSNPFVLSVLTKHILIEGAAFEFEGVRSRKVDQA